MSIDCRVVNNRVFENNHPNFGDPTAIVSKVPPGVGILVLAGDDVEITGNEIKNNHSVGIGVASLDMLLGTGSDYDMDPYPDHVHVHGNTFEQNGTDPAEFILEAGLDGADLLWDLTGQGNAWDEPGASRLPPTLPSSGWSDLRRHANQRLWRLLTAISG